MPGIIPSLASSRKHVLHSPKSLIKPRFRPHLKQRFTNRDENFGFLLLLAIVDVFAILLDSYLPRTKSRVWLIIISNW